MKKINNERKEFLNRENFSSQEEMVSLNEAIDQDFFIEQLEARLETDPLMVGGLFDLFIEQAGIVDGCKPDFYCPEFSCDTFKIH